MSKFKVPHGLASTKKEKYLLLRNLSVLPANSYPSRSPRDTQATYLNELVGLGPGTTTLKSIFAKEPQIKLKERRPRDGTRLCPSSYRTCTNHIPVRPKLHDNQLISCSYTMLISPLQNMKSRPR